MRRLIPLLPAFLALTCVLIPSGCDALYFGAPPNDSAADDTSDTDSTDTDPPIDQIEQMCTRFNAEFIPYGAEPASTWTGSVSGCSPGDIDTSERLAALQGLNIYRWLADLPEVTTDPSKDAASQACALIMDANSLLTHNPTSGMTCYTSEGASAAGSSNIAGSTAIPANPLYMVDQGNEGTIGHRRWILSNTLGPVGIGSTNTHSCMHVIWGSGAAGRAWTAWPPPGPYPAAASAVPWSHVDQVGWSVQSDSINLGGATVVVLEDGTDKPVTVHTLPANYGSASAIRIVPNGWMTQVGSKYAVYLTDLFENIHYEFEVVDCAAYR